MHKSPFDRVVWVVLDSVGIGEMPDAAAYDDAGSDTLGNMARAVGGLDVPNLRDLGLGNIAPGRIAGVPAVAAPQACFGRMREASAGKDTTTGHWEMAGVVVERAMPTYPHGFPKDIVDHFCREARLDGVIGNCVASGTEVIVRFGQEHARTGRVILYTSADSVFQVAANEAIIPIPRLYEICEAARRVCDVHGIGRVIARPFVGTHPDYKRTYNRKDYALVPPVPTLPERLTGAGVPVIGVGKIPDIFAHRGITHEHHTEGNDDGMRQTIAQTRELVASGGRGLVFTNLVDFDMAYGHRRDAAGYARALHEFDVFLPELKSLLGPRDLLCLNADHGNDPTYVEHTDHTREYVPVLCWTPARALGADLGLRSTFADLGQTVAEVFGLPPLPNGTSFLSQIEG